MKHMLVADVGGTNIRFSTIVDGKLTNIVKFLCSEFTTIDAAIVHYSSVVEQKFSVVCIAIACPVNDDQVTMLNHSWSFSNRELKQKLSLDQLFVINDFTAVAFSLSVLQGDQIKQIGGGTAVPEGNMVVFGPGTGLGVEFLTHVQDGWQTLDSEGGHSDFAPTCEDDVIVWRYLRDKNGRASSEEVLSGRGLENIYNALCQHYDIPSSCRTAADISQAALNQTDDFAVKALSQFCRIMGSFAGNLALSLSTLGGVYIGGGVVSHFPEFLANSEFRRAFEQKGRFQQTLSSVPTFLINEPDHGLLGAMAYLQQQMGASKP